MAIQRPIRGRAPARGRVRMGRRMKSQAIDPIKRLPEAGTVIDDAGPSIVELPSVGLLRAGRTTDRWLGIVIAVCAAVVCLGFVGHAATPPSVSGTPVASLAALPIREIASEAPQVLATASPASSATGIGSAHLLGEIEPVSIWHVAPIATGSGPVALTVDGYAPSTIDALTVVVRSRSGALLRSAVAPVAVDDERPGSDGQRRLGLGTFHLRIVLARSILVDGCLVETSWHDLTTDSQGSTIQVIQGIGG
jgi:hypothetical protein